MNKKIKVILIITSLVSVGIFAGFTIVYFLAETPVFELPINDISVVSGIQTFHEPGGTQVHQGFDFTLRNDTEIISPVDGVVTSVHKFQMSNNLWIIDVFISINIKWKTFIAFEPCTYNESVIDAQMLNITVKNGDKVSVGETLGILNPVNGSEFPHIHWSVIERDWNIFDQENDYRSPYRYCSVNAKLDIEFLCTLFGKFPDYD
ncbi:MAG: M23 family metallopeptidase [Candidatus Hodarchaeota archaeon]